MVDYDGVVFMTNHSPSTSRAAEVHCALEHGESVLSVYTGTDSNAFSTEASSLTLVIFISSLTFIVFSTEIMDARLHTLTIHWYFSNISNTCIV